MKTECMSKFRTADPEYQARIDKVHDTIFSTVRNAPDMRENAPGIIDHYKIDKGTPCSRGKISGCIVPEIGAFYKSNGPLPYIPSYTKIGEKSTALEPAVLDKQGHELVPDKVHTLEIVSGTIVLIDGFFVAEAPNAHAAGKKYTAPEKLKFCKAVVWQILVDEGTLKDTLANIESGKYNPLVVYATFTDIYC